jgi:hypothetical protein
MMNVPKTALLPKTAGRISGQWVSVQPISENSRNSGTMTTSLGISRAVSSRTNMMLRPAKRIRAKA